MVSFIASHMIEIYVCISRVILDLEMLFPLFSLVNLLSHIYVVF